MKKSYGMSLLVLALLTGCSSGGNIENKKEEETLETPVSQETAPEEENTEEAVTVYGQAVSSEDLIVLRRMAADEIIAEVGDEAYKGINNASFSASTNGIETSLAGEFSYMNQGLLTSQPFHFIFKNENGKYFIQDKQFGDDVSFNPSDIVVPENEDDSSYTVDEVKIKDDGTRIWTFNLANGYFTANGHHSGSGSLRVWITDMDNNTIETLIDQSGDFSVSKTANVEPGLYKIWIVCTGGDWGISWSK